jgi:hypothetical protein
MQSEDIHGQIVQTERVDLARPVELQRAIEAAQQKGAVTHVIAELPVPGEILRIHGLKYQVLNADDESGRLLLQLMGPEDQADSHSERRHAKRRK